MLRWAVELLEALLRPLSEPEPVVVEYNVVTPEHNARAIEARSRELMLPSSLSLGYIVPADTTGTPTLSLRSWPLGRPDAAFEHEPTDQEIIVALEKGWETYVAEPSEERERILMAARANAYRGW
jgi:hypothetical protein